ncbi:MAG: hypothetical protein Q7T87_12745 [Polaromonas sp.]|nr:hypothetical protein [Polaromonas sp.]
MTTLLPSQWIAECAVKLRERWTTVDQAMLEEVAMDLWMNPDFRGREPSVAAADWLMPINATSAGELPEFHDVNLR